MGNKIGKLQNSKANYLINGWEVAGIAVLQSGAPYTPTVDGNPSNNIDNHDRPNVVPGVSFYPAHKSVNQWTNPAAFSLPTPYTFGNPSETPLPCPGYGASRSYVVPTGGPMHYRYEPWLLDIMRSDSELLTKIGIKPCVIDNPCPGPLPEDFIRLCDMTHVRAKERSVRLTEKDATWLKACGVAWEREPASQLPLDFYEHP